MILPKIHVEKNGSNINPTIETNLPLKVVCDGYFRENIINPIKKIM
jgi:hypothetical protein